MEYLGIYLGRKYYVKKEFKTEGDFQSLYDAQLWLSERDYGYGSGCAMMPTAIVKGDYYKTSLPHKWKNFTKKEKNSVDGVITGDMRNGTVFIHIFN